MLIRIVVDTGQICEVWFLTVLLLLLGRVAVCTAIAAYSVQTFPLTISRSVGLSVCPVHCGKTADRTRMPFGVVGRTGPWLSLIHI